MITTSSDVERQLHSIDELDLEPIAFRLVHPEPDETRMTIERADQLIVKYRRFLKLCAMYPEQGIVPSKEIDLVWHTHLEDTAKYADDCNSVFGFMLHHFPYLGSRGKADLELLHKKGAETRALYEQHFGENMFDGEAVGNTGLCFTSCADGGCYDDGGTQGGKLERPRLMRV